MFFNNEAHSGIRIVSVHRLYWEKRHVTIPPKETYALSLRTVGDAEFTTATQKLHAGSGDVVFFSKGVGYLLNAGKEDLFAINFEMDGKQGDFFEVMYAKNLAVLTALFEEAYHTWLAKDAGYVYKTLSIFYRILAKMVEQTNEQNENAALKRLKPALEVINSQFTEPELSVSDMAASIDVSETYFRKLFEDALGRKPLEYLNSLRISYAKELIQSGFYTVAQVAQRSGFYDPKYFSTAFKRNTGFSPSDFQKNQKNK